GPRLLTVAAALVLISALFMIGVRTGGVWAGGLAAGLLIASPAFLELSSSCMVEIPALAPAVAAICLLLWARQAPAATWPVEVLAGALIAISLQIKFINAPLLAVAALAIW